MTKQQVIEFLEDIGAIQGFGVYNVIDDSYFIGGFKGYIVPYNLSNIFNTTSNYGFLIMSEDGWGTNYDYRSGLEKIKELIMDRFELIYLEMKQKESMFVMTI